MKAIEAAKAAMIKARDVCLESCSPRSADEMVTFMLMPAIRAYLSALAEDDETVERVARAMLADELAMRPTLTFRAAWEQESDIWLSNARAALRALKETKP